MADDLHSSGARPPMNVYTAMLLLAFVAVSIGCLLLAIELFSRGLPLTPPL
jgi:hypothetical protein